MIFDTPQPLWILLLGAGVGFLVAYAATKIGLGLLREPEIGRKTAELAVWLGIPTVWLALAAINLLLTEGANDVFVWPVLAATGVLSSAALVGSALTCDPEESGATSSASADQLIPGDNALVRKPSRTMPLCVKCCFGVCSGRGWSSAVLERAWS